MVSRCTSIIVVYVLSLKEVSLYKTLIHAIHLIALQCWLCNYIHRLSAVCHNVIVFVTVWTQWNVGKRVHTSVVLFCNALSFKEENRHHLDECELFDRNTMLVMFQTYVRKASCVLRYASMLIYSALFKLSFKL